MKRNLSIALVVLLLVVLNFHTAYSSDFKLSDLSKDGQQAYNKLLEARTFSIGLIGWSAQQSSNEIALRSILHEKKAIKALKSLIQNATPEGSLYGLFGLRMLDIKTFNKELVTYKLKPEPTERLRYPVADAEPPRKYNKIRSGDVIVQSGCVAINASRRKIISSIEAGLYDERFKLNKTGVDYVLQDGTVIKSN